MLVAMSPEELTTWVSTIAAAVLMVASVGLTIWQRIEQARFEDHKRWLELNEDDCPEKPHEKPKRKRARTKPFGGDTPVDE